MHWAKWNWIKQASQLRSFAHVVILFEKSQKLKSKDEWSIVWTNVFVTRKSLIWFFFDWLAKLCLWFQEMTIDKFVANCVMTTSQCHDLSILAFLLHTKFHPQKKFIASILFQLSQSVCSTFEPFVWLVVNWEIWNSVVKKCSFMQFGIFLAADNFAQPETQRKARIGHCVDCLCRKINLQIEHKQIQKS